MKYDVAALGELLIDFTSAGQSATGNPIFEANPGGAPGNVLAMLARLGHKTAFIGKVGNDMFGRQLTAALEACDIDTRGVLPDAHASTTLAFVRNAQGGEREFTFLRENGADTRLRPEETDMHIVQSCHIFHFGSLSLTHSPAREATRNAIAAAKAAGALISYDPNLRPLLWGSLVDAKGRILWGCEQCDIIKISDDELEFLSGERDARFGAEWLRGQFPNIRLSIVTKGASGADGYADSRSSSVPAFLSERTVDTTGAGDIFLGCCLSHVLAHGIDGVDLHEMLMFASAAASLVTQKKGALTSVPERREIMALLEKSGLIL